MSKAIDNSTATMMVAFSKLGSNCSKEDTQEKLFENVQTKSDPSSNVVEDAARPVLQPTAELLNSMMKTGKKTFNL